MFVCVSVGESVCVLVSVCVCVCECECVCMCVSVCECHKTRHCRRVTGLRKSFRIVLKEGILLSSSTYRCCNSPDDDKLPHLLLMTCQLQTELAVVMRFITAVKTN